MAFMVPLVKNHYDIYSRNQAPDTDSVFISAASLGKPHHRQQQQHQNRKTNQTVTLNGNLKRNERKSRKTIVIALSTNGQARIQSSSISLPNSGSRGGAIKSTPVSKSNAISAPRPLPHVRRTVRNPLNNRVYSYSVSIPDYVAEEDEDQLAQEEKELAENGVSSDDLIFSTSAPAGTGSIGNGILSDDDDLLCYDSEIASNDTTPCSSMPSSPDGVNDSQKLRSHTFDISLHQASKTSSINAPSSMHSISHPLNHHQLPNACTSTNSREYTELLRKFILHLKMLKLGSASRLFGNKSSDKSNKKSSEKASDNADNTAAAEQSRRRRKNTLEDSKYL